MRYVSSRATFRFEVLKIEGRRIALVEKSSALRSKQESGLRNKQGQHEY